MCEHHLVDPFPVGLLKAGKPFLTCQAVVLLEVETDQAECSLSLWDIGIINLQAMQHTYIQSFCIISNFRAIFLHNIGSKINMSEISTESSE